MSLTRPSLLDTVFFRTALKGVDGESKWRVGTREKVVRLDGWCEDGLGQQKNDGGG